MDALDKNIVKLLRKDGRLSSNQIAKELEVSPATIRRRLSSLTEEEGLRITAVIDPGKIGLPVAGIFLINAKLENLDLIWNAFFKFPETRWASYTAGDFNLMFISAFSSSEELAEFVKNKLSKIEGIKQSKTIVGLNLKSAGSYSII